MCMCVAFNTVYLLVTMVTVETNYNLIGAFLFCILFFKKRWREKHNLSSLLEILILNNNGLKHTQDVTKSMAKLHYILLMSL